MSYGHYFTPVSDWVFGCGGRASTCLTAVRLVRVPMLLLSAITIACDSRLEGVYEDSSDLLYTGNAAGEMCHWLVLIQLLPTPLPSHLQKCVSLLGLLL